MSGSSLPNATPSLRVVLLEDEAPALAQLTAALRAARPDAVVVATFDTVAAARAWFATNSPPDLVVSDIQLADGLALSLFADDCVRCPVVFATAYDTYLLDAFRCTSVDYLLKPIGHEDVARAIAKHERLRDTFARARPSPDAFGALADVAREPRRRLLVRRGPELRALSVDDVAYAFAEDKLTVLVTHAGAEHVIDKTLQQLEGELDGRAFFRAHRGCIVSAASIKSIRSAGKGRIALTLAPRPRDDVIVPQESGAAFRVWFDR